MDTKELIKDFNKNFPNIDKDLFLYIPREELHREFFYYLDAKPKCSINSYMNKLIKYYQQDTFYAHEKALWKDDDIKVKLLDNRMHYLGKKPDELTTNDILTGFKKSGIHYGYSGFNPLLAKWFFEQYNCKVCYDPCGGWGHRMLGAVELEKYIYNDLSYSTAKNVSLLKNDYDFFNTEIYCEDARTFMPNEDYDCMFTCPPYYNTEHYECGDFESEGVFIEFMDLLFEKYLTKDSCRVFGLVIREDLLYSHTDFSEKIAIHNSKRTHLNEHKKYDEYLYVYKKH